MAVPAIRAFGFASIGEFKVNPARHIFTQSLTLWCAALLLGLLVELFLGVPLFGGHDDEGPGRADMLRPLFRGEPQDFG